MKKLIILIVVVVIVALGIIFWPKISAGLFHKNTSQVVCTMEAKLCPDGSYVGRSGPKCEFKKCPIVTATSTPVISTSTDSITLGVGQKGEVAGINITLNKIVSDSRCAIDAVCVWAGMVTANVTLESKNYPPITKDINSNKGLIFYDSHVISIVSITPIKKLGNPILSSEYKVIFKIVKAQP